MRHQCPHCSSNYTRRYHLRAFEKKKHDVDEVTKKKYFGCPFTCGIPSFRTMIELCESAHDQSLGKLNSYIIYRQYITYIRYSYTPSRYSYIITGKRKLNLTA